MTIIHRLSGFNFIVFILTLTSAAQAQQVLIGNGEQDPSAILQINSEDRGVFISRMTEEEIMAIPNPAEGLQVYNIDTNCKYIRNIGKWVMTCPNEHPRPPLSFTYNSIAPLPVPMSHLKSFSLDNQAFVGLGRADTGISNRIFKYDLVTEDWVEISPFPDLRTGPVSFVIDNQAYMGLGRGGPLPQDPYFNDFYKYDHIQDSWEQVAPFPGSVRINAVSFIIDSEAYVIGGFNGGVPSDCYKYSPISNTWTQVANTPGPINDGVAFTIDEYGYAGAGNSPINHRFFKYNAIIDSWTPIAKYPIDFLYGAISFTIKGKTIIGTGLNSSGYYDSMYSYNPDKNRWVEEPSFVGGPRAFSTAFVINDQAYIGGGLNSTEKLSDFYTTEETKQVKSESLHGIPSWNDQVITYSTFNNQFPNQEGGVVLVESGMNSDQIIGVNIYATNSDQSNLSQIPPNTVSIPESEYFYFIHPDGRIEIRMSESNSSNLMGQPFSVFLTHLN